jgi:hypothetical protein
MQSNITSLIGMWDTPHRVSYSTEHVDTRTNTDAQNVTISIVKANNDNHKYKTAIRNINTKIITPDNGVMHDNPEHIILNKMGVQITQFVYPDRTIFYLNNTNNVYYADNANSQEFYFKDINTLLSFDYNKKNFAYIKWMQDNNIHSEIYNIQCPFNQIILYGNLLYLAYNDRFFLTNSKAMNGTFNIRSVKSYIPKNVSNIGFKYIGQRLN